MKRKKQLIAILTAGLMLSASVPEILNMVTQVSFTANAVDEKLKTGQCGENAYWSLENATLRIYGTGELEGYANEAGLPDGSKAPWYPYASEIEKVIIESGITNTGYGFISDTGYSYPNLISVEIADSVKYIGRGAFCGCPKLESIVIPANVESIAMDSFGRCDGLKSITFLGNKTYVYNWCFSTSENFDVYFNGTEEEWKELFQASANQTLANATFHSLLEENTTEKETSGQCGDNAYWELDKNGTFRVYGTGDMYDYSSKEAPWYDIKDDVRNIIIEEGVTSIGGYAFAGFSNLEAVLIPESVTFIGKYAFSDCSKLEVIDITGNIEVIREGTFAGCKNLTMAIIPESVKTVETDAFKGADITWLLYGGYTTVNTLTKDIKFSSGNGCITNTDFLNVYVFNEVHYNGIEKKCYGKAGNDAYFEFKDGIFRVYGTGELWDYDPFICYDFLLDGIETVIIEEGITRIGRMNFSGCENLTSVSIPDSVISITDPCFGGTPVLDNGDGYIDGWLIKYDGSEIKDGTRGIGTYAIGKDVKTITIPKSVKAVSWSAFMFSNELEDAYYLGTEEEWKSVHVEELNDNLLKVLRFNNDSEVSTSTNAETTTTTTEKQSNTTIAATTSNSQTSGNNNDSGSSSSTAKNDSPKTGDDINKIYALLLLSTAVTVAFKKRKSKI